MITGARIWLSGSTPDPKDCTQRQSDAILEFVSRFSAQVFQLGGHILHGSHPSFIPVLLDQAEKYQKEGGKKDCLTLCVSRYFSKDRQRVQIDKWQQICTIYETPEATGENARDDSLDILRKWMAARCDAVVVVGGKLWEQIAGRAGIPVELNWSEPHRLHKR